jgi:methionine sulfoxide reductase heme-binding subunit
MKPAQQLQYLRLITHIAALIPLVWLLYDWWSYQIGPDCAPFYPTCANWIREITLRTGMASLVLLTLSLACTPIRILTGWKLIVPLRKPLGLYAFFYVCLHLSIFIWLDYGGDLGWIWQELTMRRYVMAGFAAFLLLMPLAATSTNWAQRKLGGRRWKQLHQLVYLIAGLALLHYFWLVKENYTWPIIFGVVIGFLLLVRLKKV